MSDEPVMATTWEQCARHVERGGVVEVQLSAAAFEAQREALGRQRPTVEVPDGHELVVLPCDVVDAWASNEVQGSRRAVVLLDACRAAVARRPKPETEWVPWWEAVGRIAPDGRRINEVRHHRRGEPTVVTSAPSPAEFPPVGPDGMVEVLIEDRS